MGRLLRFQGQLKIGGQELLQAGGSPAAKLAEKWGLDKSVLEQASPEKLLSIIQRRLVELNDPAEQVAFSMDLMGKSAVCAMNVLRDESAIEKWTQRVKELNIATADQVLVAKEWTEIKKELELKKEGYATGTMTTAGFVGMGWDKWKMAELTASANDIDLGAGNWIVKSLGGKAQINGEMSQEISTWLIRKWATLGTTPTTPTHGALANSPKCSAKHPHHSSAGKA